MTEIAERIKARNERIAERIKARNERIFKARMNEQSKSLDAKCPHCGEQIRIKLEKKAEQQEQDSVWQAPVISKDLTTPPI